MRRFTIFTITMLALTSFMATTVQAQNPHFINCSASGPVAPDGSVNVSFKIAGLGANETITITVTADASGLNGCLNKGQQCPNAANKFEGIEVKQTGMFTSGKNGSITGMLTLEPPPPTLDCPKGQTSVLVNITYTNLVVTAPPAGTCTPSPTTLTANFFPQCP
jgi:hypothetical protein